MIAVLLIALWYCHKRGREVRHENELAPADEAADKLNENNEGDIRPAEPATATTADSLNTPGFCNEATDTSLNPRLENTTGEKARKKENRESVTMPWGPSRSRSRLSIWSRSGHQKSTSSIEPYPGT